MTTRLGNLAASLGDLVFPPTCLHCGGPAARDVLFCDSCWAEQPALDPGCPLCGAGSGCGCAQFPPPFATARAAGAYGGPLARALCALKYRRQWSLAPGLGRLLAAGCPAGWRDWADLVAPVPLHRWRLIQRGFNQSGLLARGLDPGAKLLPRLLTRRRHTRPQVGLDPGQRRANVAGAFGVRPAERGRVAGARVLLIDDVFTTGATVGECASALLAAGAAQVRVLTLTRAQPGKDRDHV